MASCDQEMFPSHHRTIYKIRLAYLKQQRTPDISNLKSSGFTASELMVVAFIQSVTALDRNLELLS